MAVTRIKRQRRPSRRPRLKFPRFKPPLGVYIAICALPAVMTILFYALRFNTAVMSWISMRVALPIRGFLGLITSIFPFSLMEVAIAAAIVGTIVYIFKTIKLTVNSRKRRIRVLSKRLLHIAVAALYIWGAFCWLWNTGYFARGFAERNGIEPREVSVYELIALTEMFAARASELAPTMSRDADGRLNEDRRAVFAASGDIFQNIAQEFPELGRKTFRPKPMMFSWLMSRTGYSGIYFALTGEANINSNIPMSTMPATIAHELAHQLGVHAEDEANFVAIIASISSEHPVYVYSGYFFGLIHLMNALHTADPAAWADIFATFSPELRRDWTDNRDFWRAQRTVDTGIGFLDTVLTAVTETAREAVNTFYDGFLRAQNQELGLQSYGACVDLLIVYFFG